MDMKSKSLLDIRLGLGLTRKQVADLAGITPNQLLGIEIGVNKAMEKKVREVLESLQRGKA